VNPIRLFVGFDSEQPLASQVFAFSAARRSSLPLSIQFLVLSQLREIFRRDREPLQSTEFAFTRFLVPFLCGYEGWAIFADGDMICLDDIAGLWNERDSRHAVQVVKRDQHGMTEQGLKFLGRAQTPYQRKNWSSVMLFNCRACRQLTPGYVETAPGLDLHQFAWVRDEADIGALPADWNHLVGVDEPRQTARIVHFTLGMPYFRGLRECEFATEWREERDAMMRHVGGPCGTQSAGAEYEMNGAAEGYA